MIEINEAQFIEDFKKQEPELLKKVPGHASKKTFIKFAVRLGHYIVWAVYCKQKQKFISIEYTLYCKDYTITL